ncbi:hypothetical protein AYO38_06310 [bacterium SCGC AG-212-C10]|nr:hypothetical protein AYO38_06310 [bacterium SCGC AG-212-C10]
MTQLIERNDTGEDDASGAYTPIQLKIFRDRYALGEETFPHEAWNRVATAVASNEVANRQDVWSKRFFDLLAGFRYVPGGRILAAMGSGAGVTAQNCYVIPSPEDSRKGIMDSLAEWVEIQSKGGGVGVNMSSLRPRNELVKGVNGTSSGPVSWSQLFAFVSHDIIIQGGSRRGAAMIMLDVEHPDIFEFIHAKEHPGVLEGCNISVCLSDAFMDAVERDADWDLQWQGRVYNTVKARQIWDEICQAAWKSAEPGIYFMDRANKESNSGYFETLISTNPCVTGDAWVQTSDGPRQVHDLIGRAFNAVVDGASHATGAEGFFKTGTKPVLELATREGYSLRLTGDHPIRRVAKRTRWSIESEWVAAAEIVAGDEVVLNNHRALQSWAGAHTEAEGYLLGLLIGDGVLKKDKAVLSAWTGAMVVNGGYERPGVHGIMSAAEAAARTLPHRSDFQGWIEVPGRGEWRLSLAALKSLAGSLGLAPGAKGITPAAEATSSEFHAGLLRGLFDADGSVQGTQEKGVSIRLAQSDVHLLSAAQRMLLRLGIASTIFRDRRPAGTSRLPDGKGGQADYAVLAQHELVIAGDNLGVFAERVGFADTAKAARLQQSLATYSRTPNRERFVAVVESVEPAGVEDVYDVQVPGINAFDANGLYVHNCGEQPLGEYGACLLGSFNLGAFLVTNGGETRFDFDAFAQYIPYAVRFNDNVVDLSNYPLEQCRQSQHDIRRMGIGVMGLADVLLQLNLRYGSPDAIEFTEQIFRTLRDESYRASVRLAEERGSFPKFIAEKYLERPFIKRLPEDIREGIRRHGIRNCYLLTQAPTGTTSLLSGVNSGIEPYFDFDYLRSDRTGDYSVTSSWADMYGEPDRPHWLVAANDITPEEHVLMQAAAQRYNDSSISKTANAPESHTVDDVRRLYMLAYHEGLKSISYYRDNSRSVQVLYHKDGKEDGGVTAEAVLAEAQALLAKGMGGPVRRKLPDERQAITHKFRVGEQEGYMTVGLFDDGTPGEVFINVNKQGSTVSGLMDTVAMLTSYSLQYGVPLNELASKLKNTRFEPSGPTGNPRIPIATSIIDYVFRWLELKFDAAAAAQPSLIPAADIAVSTSADTQAGKHLRSVSSGVACPECGEVLWWAEGCMSCRTCGYTKCG